MTRWEELIRTAETLTELDEIIEQMAEDENISNDEYTALYEMALNRAR